MSEILDLFRKYADVDFSVVQLTDHYENVGNRWPVSRPNRKKRRLQKKWLKRFGPKIKRILRYRYDRQISNPREISLDDEILLKMHLSAKPSQTMHLATPPRLTAYDLQTDSPFDQSVEIKTTTYEFPKIGSVQRLSYEFYIEFYKNDDLKKSVFSDFLRRAEMMIENGTKINGVSGYGDLEAEILI